ncbi:MAG: hypothetical protein ABSB86_15930 [Bryobacteraceae bacterium]
MAKRTTGRGPNLIPASDEMRHLFALLGEELVRWSGVSARSMFGLRAFYRGSVIFAMLPEKRAFENPRLVYYKLPRGGEKKAGEMWRQFELKNERDIDKALAHLNQAYDKAAA